MSGDTTDTNKPKKVVLATYIDEDLLKRIDERREELGWSRSQYMRRAIIRALEQKDER